jgi:hypothetical protein
MFNSGMRGFGAGLIVASGILAIVHYQSDPVDSKANAEDKTAAITYDQVESYLESKGLVAVRKEEPAQPDKNETKGKESDKADKEKKAEEPKEEVIKTTLVISKGTSTGQVSDWLESKKIIKSSDALIQYLRSNSLESKVRFGEYEVNNKMTLAEIAHVITSP